MIWPEWFFNPKKPRTKFGGLSKRDENLAAPPLGPSTPSDPCVMCSHLCSEKPSQQKDPAPDSLEMPQGQRGAPRDLKGRGRTGATSSGDLRKMGRKSRRFWQTPSGRARFLCIARSGEKERRPHNRPSCHGSMLFDTHGRTVEP